MDRVEQDEKFIEINKKLAKFALEDDVIHLAELIRERKEADEEDESSAAEGETSEADASAADKKMNEAAKKAAPGSKGAGEEESKKLEESATPSSTDEDKKDEPTPQRMEALRILADLVELQETKRSSWHAPQSASRSESPSSQR